MKRITWLGRRAWLGLVALAAVGVATVAGAATVGGAIQIGHATFAASVVARETPLELHGAGLMRWGFFVKVQAAALYVAAGRPFHPDEDAPRRLELTYFVPFSKEDLAGAAGHILRQNFRPEELEPLKARLDALHDAYVDVRSGDRVTITYVPGRGTELALNGRVVAEVEGADFARAYFAIYLGAHPLDEGLRRALLAPRSRRG